MTNEKMTRDEMIKSLEGAMSLAGVLWNMFKSASADLEANREGMGIIADEIEGRICDVLESLKDEERPNTVEVEIVPEQPKKRGGMAYMQKTTD